MLVILVSFAFAFGMVLSRVGLPPMVGFLAAGSTPSSRLVNCCAENCATDGFSGCWNLSNCGVDGANDTARGFFGCYNLSSCYAYDATGSGFRQCSRIAACSVDEVPLKAPALGAEAI